MLEEYISTLGITIEERLSIINMLASRTGLDSRFERKIFHISVYRRLCSS
jgi:hypothetical protein